MANFLEEQKLEIINEEIMIISSLHSILHDSIIYREFQDDKNVMGEYSIVMDIINHHMQNILKLF